MKRLRIVGMVLLVSVSVQLKADIIDDIKEDIAFDLRKERDQITADLKKKQNEIIDQMVRDMQNEIDNQSALLQQKIYETEKQVLATFLVFIHEQLPRLVYNIVSKAFKVTVKHPWEKITGWFGLGKKDGSASSQDFKLEIPSKEVVNEIFDNMKQDTTKKVQDKARKVEKTLSIDVSELENNIDDTPEQEPDYGPFDHFQKGTLYKLD